MDKISLIRGRWNRMRALAITTVLAVQIIGAPVAHAAIAATPQKTKGVEVPKGFKALSTVPIDGGNACVAGVTRDADAMNQRALVYVEDAKKRPVWSAALKLRDDWYQNRATKCLGIGTDVFVLVESDTDSHQATSQTFLSVIKLSAADGKIEGSKNLVIDEATGPNSAWVGAAQDGFTLASGKIVVKGNYFLMSDPDTKRPFSVIVPTSLDK